MNRDFGDHLYRLYREQARAVAVLLGEVVSLPIDPARLSWLRSILNRIETAAAQRDSSAMRSAAGHLIVLSTARLVGIGDSTAVPPQDLPRERINALVHALLDDDPKETPPSSAPDPNPQPPASR